MASKSPPGKIEIAPTIRVEDHDDLSRVYTPGVAEDVQRVADDDSALAQVTGARNRIFVVTDGSAILGLGDVGPRARPARDGRQGRPVQATGRRRCLAVAAALAAAADAVASLVDEPGPQAIVPDVFDERLVDRVATAVVDYAQEVQVPWMRSD